MYSEALGAVIKGRRTALFIHGQAVTKGMLLCGVSYKGLQEEVRLKLNEATMENVQEIFMERSGKISVVKKESGGK